MDEFLDDNPIYAIQDGYYNQKTTWDKIKFFLGLAGIFVSWPILVPWYLILRFWLLRDEF